jgi:hypothetical protein
MCLDSDSILFAYRSATPAMQLPKTTQRVSWIEEKVLTREELCDICSGC